MDALVTCKYEEDPIKNEGARVFTTFSPLQPYSVLKCSSFVVLDDSILNAKSLAPPFLSIFFLDQNR